MILILTGAPGAGKGTQADLLADRDGFRKISTGDALRNQIKKGTEIGLKASGYMSAGKLVPDDILLSVLKAEMEAAAGQKILLDGYPRNVNQAESLDKICPNGAVAGVVHLDVAREALITRLSGRRVCSQCGSSFHLTLNPPRTDGICDRCGGSMTQRPDDSAEKVAIRLDVYESETKPVLEFYKARGLYRKVDGNRGTEDVYRQIHAHVVNFAD